MVHEQIFISLPKEELQNLIREAVHTAVTQKLITSLNTEPQTGYYTRKQTSEILHISLGTLDSYTKTGLLTAYKIGHRILYKQEDINNYLNQKIVFFTPSQNKAKKIKK